MKVQKITTINISSYSSKNSSNNNNIRPNNNKWTKSPFKTKI